MCKQSVFIILILMLVMGVGWAQETDSTAEANDQLTAEQATHAKDQARLEELMDVMAEEMAAIRRAENRSERDALMPAHMDHMREAMGLARNMGGTRMREVMEAHMSADLESEAKNRTRPVHSHKRMVPPPPRTEMSDARRLSDLEMRVDMLQMVVESILDESAGR